MIGTIANTLAILAGSLIGGTVRRGLKEKYQNVLYVAMGLAATGLGINAVVQNMPNSPYPVLFIASLAIGGVVGTAIDLEGRFNRLVEGGQRKRRKNPQPKSQQRLRRTLNQSRKLLQQSQQLPPSHLLRPSYLLRLSPLELRIPSPGRYTSPLPASGITMTEIATAGPTSNPR